MTSTTVQYMPSMVGSPCFSMKNETLHLLTGFNNGQHILTNQIVPAHIHCIEKRELCAPHRSRLFPASSPSARSWAENGFHLYLFLSSAPPPTHARTLFCIGLLRSQGPKHSLPCVMLFWSIFTSSQHKIWLGYPSKLVLIRNNWNWNRN